MTATTNSSRLQTEAHCSLWGTNGLEKSYSRSTSDVVRQLRNWNEIKYNRLGVMCKNRILTLSDPYIMFCITLSNKMTHECRTTVRIGDLSNVRLQCPADVIHFVMLVCRLWRASGLTTGGTAGNHENKELANLRNALLAAILVYAERYNTNRTQSQCNPNDTG